MLTPVLSTLAVVVLLGGVLLLLAHSIRQNSYRQFALEIARRSPDRDHVIRVARGLDGDAEVVALLHDSIEDGLATWDEIDHLPEHILDAVQFLTRMEGDDYPDYIDRLATAPGRAGKLARRVKVRDLTDNLERSLRDDFPSLTRRYRKALGVLIGEGP